MPIGKSLKIIFTLMIHQQKQIILFESLRVLYEITFLVESEAKLKFLQFLSSLNWRDELFWINTLERIALRSLSPSLLFSLFFIFFYLENLFSRNFRHFYQSAHILLYF